MKKIVIDIDRNEPIPSWAKNYLKQNSMLEFMKGIKKTKRNVVLPQIQEFKEFAFSVDFIEANARGQIVFKWPTPQERTFFILKWS